jgi:hypothetical protein
MIKSNQPASINYINILMDRINGHTDNIYEQLMDEDYLSLKGEIKSLINLLRDTQKSFQNEL